MRDTSIDIFKGLLVIGMIFAHVIQFFGQIDRFEFYASTFINIISFSGFMFCFGYVNQIAYFDKDFTKVYKRMFKTGLKTLASFYISGICYRVFISKLNLDIETAKNVFLLRDIPGYSEFLATFSILSFFAIVFFKPLKITLEHPKIFWSIFIVLLLSTFFPYSIVTSTKVGLIIGTTKFASFPLIQYLPLYLLGMYFSKYKVGFNRVLFFGSFISTGFFVEFVISRHHQLPSRFPPSLQWILSSFLFLYLYFLFSKYLDKINAKIAPIKHLGENVLFCLITSNVFIFVFKFKNQNNQLNFFECVGFAVLLIAVIYYLIIIIVPKKRSA